MIVLVLAVLEGEILGVQGNEFNGCEEGGDCSLAV
jgi:hypothetical protein